jgi:hypothetical protein
MKDDVVFTAKPRRHQPSRPRPARLNEIFPAGADGRSPVNWAQASPALRDACNRLRKMRGLALIPEPAIDLYQPLQPARKPFDFFVEPPQKGVRWPKSEKERTRPNPDLLRIVHGDHTLWQDLCNATKSLLDASDGDLGLLRKRMYARTVTAEEIDLAADLLGNKVQRPAHKPRQIRIEVKRELTRRCLMEWIKAGEPKKDPEGGPFKIVEAVQQYFGRTGLSRTVICNIIAEIKRPPKVPAAASLALSGSTPAVAIAKMRIKKGRLSKK